MDEARRTQRFDVLRRLGRPETEAGFRQSHDGRVSEGNTHFCKYDVPLDALEGAAGHVDDAPRWPGHRTNQTFAHTLEEACRSLLLGSCKVATRPQHHYYSY